MKPVTVFGYSTEMDAYELAVAVERAKADYLEMPGLQLTEAQAARLWCLSGELCSRVLAHLVEAQFLTCARMRYLLARSRSN